MLYKLSFNFGSAQRLGPGETGVPCVCAGRTTTPRYGYAWWFWLPTLYYNGGRPDRVEVLDLSFSWLCYWCSITAWPRQDGSLKPWFHSSLDGLQTSSRKHAANRKRTPLVDKSALRRA